MLRNQRLKSYQLVSIGELAERSGLAVSKIRYYEKEGLLHAVRTKGGTRYFRRADNRRLGFIAIAQKFGYNLSEIKDILSKLPQDRAPNKFEWQKISKVFKDDIDVEIRRLGAIRHKLDGCIGCGCLSLDDCPLFNPDDEVGKTKKGAGLIPL